MQRIDELVVFSLIDSQRNIIEQLVNFEYKNDSNKDFSQSKERLFQWLGIGDRVTG